MIVREMTPIDLYRIRIERPTQPMWREMGGSMLKAGPCWTAVRHGQVMACAGLVLHWQGRAGTWCLISADFPRRAWPWLHKAVMHLLPQAMRELRLHRVEAETLAGWEPGALWLRKLGFRSEDIAPCFGPDGADYVRWSLLNRPAADVPQETAHG